MEKMRQLSISLTPEQYGQVMEWAREDGRTAAQVMRGLVMREAARLAAGQPPELDALNLASPSSRPGSRQR